MSLSRRSILSAGVLAGLTAPVIGMGQAQGSPPVLREQPVAATSTGKAVLVLGLGSLSLYTQARPGRYSFADEKVLPDDFAPVTVRTVDSGHDTWRLFGADLGVGYLADNGDALALRRTVMHTPATMAVSVIAGRIALTRKHLPVGTGVAIDGWEETTRVVLSSRLSAADGGVYRVGKDLRLSPDSGGGTTTPAWPSSRPGRVRSLAEGGGGVVAVWRHPSGEVFATALPSGHTRVVPDGAVAVGGAVAGVAVSNGSALDLIEMEV